MAEAGKQQSQQGVEHQDVTAPDEHQVQEADDSQYGHAPVENAETVCTLLHGVGDDE